MNIYATVDVAAVTEEVVEGVYAGQIYQDISSTEATDFSNGAKAEALDRGIHVGRYARSGIDSPYFVTILESQAIVLQPFPLVLLTPFSFARLACLDQAMLTPKFAQPVPCEKGQRGQRGRGYTGHYSRKLRLHHTARGFKEGMLLLLYCVLKLTRLRL